VCVRARVRTGAQVTQPAVFTRYDFPG